MTDYIEAGEFVTTFGINGEIKLYPFVDSAETLCVLKRLFVGTKEKKELKILSMREHKNMCLVTIDGITSPELARSLIGKTAYFKAEDIKLPEGRFYIEDVLGCDVKDAQTGEVYGVVQDITRPAAQDIYTVRSEDGTLHMFPGVSEFLIKVDIVAREVLVKPIQGMFSKAENADED